eukprot:959317-Prymnesium_polylepis.1
MGRTSEWDVLDRRVWLGRAVGGARGRGQAAGAAPRAGPWSLCGRRRSARDGPQNTVFLRLIFFCMLMSNFVNLSGQISSPLMVRQPTRLLIVGVITAPLSFDARGWQRRIYSDFARPPSVAVRFVLGNITGCNFFRQGDTEPRALLGAEMRRHDDFVSVPPADCQTAA